MNLDVNTFLTTMYTTIDDWYQRDVAPHKPRRRGQRPALSDSEVLTLAVLAQWQPDRSERAFLPYVATHWRAYFPRLLSQSAFNRRVHDLAGVLCRLGPALAAQFAPAGEPGAYAVVDGVPVPLMRRCRGDRHRLFGLEARVAQGGSDKEWYYGAKLLCVCNQRGFLVGFVVGPADTDERWLLEALLRWQRDPAAPAPTAAEAAAFLPPSHQRGGERRGPTGPLGPRQGAAPLAVPCLLGDLGYRGDAWQGHWHRVYGVAVLTKAAYPARADRAWFSGLRQQIETLNGLLVEPLGLKFPGARTRWGLYCRLAAKVAAYNLMLQHNLLTGRPPFSPFNPLAA
jgi:hypothetical protein